MNWDLFVSALSTKEFSDLSTAMWASTRATALKRIEGYSMTLQEASLMQRGLKIQAIQSVRARHPELSLLEAKLLVERDCDK
jgi:hypothetical protein